MNKAIVKPVHEVTLLNSTLEPIHHNRPSVVVYTEFVSQQMAEGNLRVLARGLPMEATDFGFALALKGADGDVALAVPAYCAEFNLTTEGDILDPEKVGSVKSTKGKRGAQSGSKPK